MAHIEHERLTGAGETSIGAPAFVFRRVAFAGDTTKFGGVITAAAASSAVPKEAVAPQAQATIDGDGGDNQLHAGATPDTVNGGGGDDTLIGGGGADLLQGGAGNDVLYGDSIINAPLRVSADAAGNPGNQASLGPVFSPDSTKIVFVSLANNFVVGDTSGPMDVYVKDLATGAIQRASVGAAGQQSQFDSFIPVFAPDGLGVAFMAAGDAIFAGDTNGEGDVYYKNLQTGALTLVSTNSAGVQSNDLSEPQAFSPDGTMLLFNTLGDNMGYEDANANFDLYLKNLTTGEATLVSRSLTGETGDGLGSRYGVFSPDGSKVAFWSFSNNLVAGDTNHVSDIFIYDVETGVITRVSTNSAGAQASNGHSTGIPVFSPDGTKIYFTSAANNLVANDTNATYDVFEKNLITGAVRMVSTSASGGLGNDVSDNAILSPDGLFVVFQSRANNLVANDPNGGDNDYFLKDLTTGAIVRLTNAGFGISSEDRALGVVFSPDGALVGLGSATTNSWSDVWVAPFGFGADDVLNGGPGNDALNGGAGIDTASYTDAPSAVTVSLLTTSAQNTGGAGIDTLTLMENAVGSGFNDTLTGSNAANRLEGGAGNDTLNGGNGDDVLNGGLGDDILYGGAGVDAADYSSASGAVSVNLAAAQNTLAAGVDQFTGVENLIGSGFGDTLQGDGAANRLEGGVGDDTLRGESGGDTLVGGVGADTLIGGAGNDTYFVDNLGDATTENLNEGVDTVSASRSWAVASNFENVVLTGSGDFNVAGNGLANTLRGNSGDNWINGSFGKDILTGLGGRDSFIFNRTLGPNNVDTITDYDVVRDVIRIDNAVFAGIGPAGALAVGAFNTGASATQADDRIIYDQATGKLFFDIDGVGGAAQIHFATLSTKPAGMTAGEFIII